MSRVKDIFSEIYAFRELLINLIVRNLKIRYKNSSLGFFWTLLNPLFFILIYFFFIKLMRFQMDLVGLLAGVIPWHFLSMTIGDSMDAIAGNSSLITKVRFPRIILPLATVMANTFNYFLSLIVLVILIPVIGGSLTFSLTLVFPLIILLLVFILGLSLILCTANVYFKDTPHIIGVLMMGWFFMTPIIYPMTMIPEKFRNLAFLNPMTGIISFYRSALQGHEFIPAHWTLLCISICLTVFFVGIFIFFRYEPFFADEL